MRFDVFTSLQSVEQDFRLATRTIRHNLSFATAVVFSLALGIGANTALFSVLDGLLLRLLPVQHPEGLFLLRSPSHDHFTYPEFELIRTKAPLVSRASATQYVPGKLEISDLGNKVPASLQIVSYGYFDLLGVSAARGRIFRDADMHHAVAVISDQYWRAHYGETVDPIGRQFQWAGLEFTVIGVAPPNFHGVVLDGPTDVFVPIEPTLPPGSPFRTRARFLDVMVRLEPGVTTGQVEAELTALLRRTIRVEAGGSGISQLREQIARPLLVLESLVAFVLLIACSNLANLAMAAAASRQRDLAVRQAIGASRGRLVRQLLMESFLLAFAGGALAIVIARWVNTAILHFLPPDASGLVPNLMFRADVHAVGFTAGLTLLTCFLFGLAPAMQATRSNLIANLRQMPDGSRTFASWQNRSLVVGEVCLCTVVLMTSGLFIRTLFNLRVLDPALTPEKIVVANITTAGVYPSKERLLAFNALRERANAIPGVKVSGFVHVRPLAGLGLDVSLQVEGGTSKLREDVTALAERISPGFLAAMGIPLLEGRDFNSRDDVKSPPVALVNELFARRYLSGEHAIGRRFRLVGDDHVIEIVGLVKDTRWLSLRDPPSPMLYRPFPQDSASYASLIARTTGDRSAVVAALQRLAREVNPPLIISDIASFADLEDRALFTERMIAQISTAFGSLALVIACIGLYGLLAYSVARRTREIGIRVALGSSRLGVQWLVLRQSVALVGIGFAIGLPLALAASRFAVSLLYGLAPSDPITIAVVMSVMTATALAAAWIPAHRAARIDPMAAVRYE